MLTRIDVILLKVLTSSLFMTKPVGGRGKKAAYVTTHVRVPEPIKLEVDRLIQRYHQAYSDESTNLVTSLSEAMIVAKGILTQKKSARVSMEKLLTALYKTEVQLK